MRILLLLAAFPALALSQKVSMEFDETRDFSDCKSFAIVAGKLNSRNPSLNNELVQKKLDSLGSGQRVEDEAYPAGWRGYGTRVVRRRYTEGTLILDPRDAKEHELVWRAISVEDT